MSRAISPAISTGAYSVSHVDIASVAANQAALAQLKQGSAALYAERRYLLKELNNYFGVAGIVTPLGNFAISANYAGNIEYKETRLGLIYARSLGTKADAGIQFNYYSIQPAGYGNANAITAELGAIFHLSEKLHAGLQLSNPWGGKFGNNKEEQIPSVYTIGLGYDASEKFFTCIQLSKEVEQVMEIVAALQYKIVPGLLIRSGISTATSSVWAGAGLSWKRIRLDLTSTYHPLLGITPGLMLLLHFRETKKQLLNQEGRGGK